MQLIKTTQSQRGLTLISFILTLSVIGIFLFVGMKLFPMYQEFYSVRSAMKEMANDPSMATQPPAEIRRLFFRKLYVNYSDGNLKPTDVKLERIDRGATGYNMNVRYEIRVPMVYNLDAVGRFDHSVVLSNRAGD